MNLIQDLLQVSHQTRISFLLSVDVRLTEDKVTVEMVWDEANEILLFLGRI